MSVFVTGTGTGVGKTVASAALMRRYRAVRGLRYWKPVQTGSPPDDDARSVREWCEVPDSAILPNVFRFPAPRSPHHAAELAGAEISLSVLQAEYLRHEQAGPLLCEGAGGILVPLNRKETWLDLLAVLRPSIVLVAATGLGTINHTLLSIAQLRQSNLLPVGIIFCGARDDDNVRTIVEFGGVPELGCFAFHPESDSMESLDSAALDPAGRLATHFG